MCYFGVGSKADTSQLNLPHETKKNKKSEKENKLKNKNGYAQKSR